MTLNITGDTFSFNEVAPTQNAMGGTELQMKWLRENVDNELIDKFQLIPTRIRGVDENKPSLLWLHDTADDPEVQHLKDPVSRAQFEKLIYVSYWQKQQFEDYLGIPPSKGVVMKNAIYPIPRHEKPTDQINIIYHTTPHRGLNLVLAAFDHLSKLHDNIHLDIYSSFKVYGWDHRDVDYQSLFDMADAHPNITNHGAVSNDEVRTALQKAHIFAYPSIWTETSCIAMIEAMSAGCLNICSSLGALPETTGNFAWMYPYQENLDVHVNMFTQGLDTAIRNVRNESVQNNLHMQMAYINMFHSWEFAKQSWTHFLQGMVK